MEKELVWKMVQGQIGYDFKNRDLLQQAFTRRSYTAENRKDNARHISLNLILCFRLFTRVHFHKQE